MRKSLDIRETLCSGLPDTVSSIADNVVLSRQLSSCSARILTNRPRCRRTLSLAAQVVSCTEDETGNKGFLSEEIKKKYGGKARACV